LSGPTQGIWFTGGRQWRIALQETRHLNGIAIDGGVSPGFQLMIPEGEVSED
tara:strand:- start:809 stop:964 length:156 start_codon:yes stop_codon:yes gene_type:complete